jgi:hypothetical protein
MIVRLLEDKAADFHFGIRCIGNCGIFAVKRAIFAAAAPISYQAQGREARQIPPNQTFFEYHQNFRRLIYFYAVLGMNACGGVRRLLVRRN